MPAKYEAIRDSLIAKGESDKAAKRSAARIFNSQRSPSEAPVTGKDKPMSFAKGSGPKVAHYAEGGPVLGRTREFLKEPVTFRKGEEVIPINEGRSVDKESPQQYGKGAKGSNAGGGDGVRGRQEKGKTSGCKELKAIKPRG